MLTRGDLPKLLAVILVATVVGAGLAHAQSPLGIGTQGIFGGFFAFINAEQQVFYRTLTGYLKAMRDNPWNVWPLVGLSFAYGVLHAAGPGHGKAVISSYMIANEVELKRGVVLSFLSSLMQGGVAILLIGATYLVLRGTSISMTQATHALEMTSFALIALFGFWLLVRKTRAIRAKAVQSLSSSFAAVPVVALSGHGHGHHRHNDHHTHHAHHDHGAGDVCATCGHAHAPDPSTLKGDTFALGDAWSAIVAVGLRPCSGALIVLSFALLNGLYLGGILSVLAMSIGTAITVSVLATLAVTAKGLALRYTASGSSAMRVTNAIEIGGAVLVMLLGIVLFLAALEA